MGSEGISGVIHHLFRRSINQDPPTRIRLQHAQPDRPLPDRPELHLNHEANAACGVVLATR